MGGKGLREAGRGIRKLTGPCKTLRMKKEPVDEWVGIA